MHVVEDIYLDFSLQRFRIKSTYIPEFTASDYLRPGEGMYIGSITSSTTAGDKL